MTGAGRGGWLAREIRHMVPPFLFFLLAFNLLALTAQLAKAPGGLMHYATAVISALICAKAVLIADAMPFFNRFPERPLIWNVVWKTLLYSLITSLLRLLEGGFEAWRADPHLGEGVEALAAQFTWARFTMIQLWLTALFLVYTAFRELAEVVGRERVWHLFFGPMEARRD